MYAFCTIDVSCSRCTAIPREPRQNTDAHTHSARPRFSASVVQRRRSHTTLRSDKNFLSRLFYIHIYTPVFRTRSPLDCSRTFRTIFRFRRIYIVSLWLALCVSRCASRDGVSWRPPGEMNLFLRNIDVRSVKKRNRERKCVCV